MLTNRQKQLLAQLAARAFKLRPRTWSAVAESKAAQDDWRRAEVAKACGKHGLRCCRQADFLAVQAHFLAMMPGAQPAALNTYIRAASEPARSAEWHLWNALKKWGISPNYAEAICRRQYKCAITEATPKQLWNLKFTIDARGRAKRKLETGNRKPETSPTPQPHANN